ncbi:MAG: hypothetical protein IPO32_20835 [Crocinitomicaceae bacterium]|nr:hypothetical protein [Crocinitomicaceae bacterium]
MSHSHTKSLKSKEVHAGESIGYGRTYIATRDHLIGVIPVGYADGLRRALESRKLDCFSQRKTGLDYWQYLHGYVHDKLRRQ